MDTGFYGTKKVLDALDTTSFIYIVQKHCLSMIRHHFGENLQNPKLRQG